MNGHLLPSFCALGTSLPSAGQGCSASRAEAVAPPSCRVPSTMQTHSAAGGLHSCRGGGLASGYLCSWSFHAVHGGALWRHTLATERKEAVVSLVDPPGPSSRVGEAGKERSCTTTSHSHYQPQLLPAACPSSRIPTIAPGKVVLPQKTRRQSLED